MLSTRGMFGCTSSSSARLCARDVACGASLGPAGGKAACAQRDSCCMTRRARGAPAQASQGRAAHLHDLLAGQGPRASAQLEIRGMAQATCLPEQQ